MWRVPVWGLKVKCEIKIYSSIIWNCKINCAMWNNVWNAAALVSHCWLTIALKSATAPAARLQARAASSAADCKTTTPILISLSRPREITSSQITSSPTNQNISQKKWGTRPRNAIKTPSRRAIAMILRTRVNSDLWPPACPCHPLASAISCAERVSDNVTVTARVLGPSSSRVRRLRRRTGRPVFGLCPCACTDLLWSCDLFDNPWVTSVCDLDLEHSPVCVRVRETPWKTLWQVLSDFLSRVWYILSYIAPQVVIFCLVLLSRYFRYLVVINI
jgi:hypothetical protein